MISRSLIEFQVHIPGFYRAAFNLGINEKIKEFLSSGKNASELFNLLFTTKQLNEMEQADTVYCDKMVFTETCGLLDAEFNDLLDKIR